MHILSTFVNSCIFVKIEGQCQVPSSTTAASASGNGNGNSNSQSSNSNQGGNSGNPGGNGSGGGASEITGSVLLTALSIGFLCFMKLK